MTLADLITKAQELGKKYPELLDKPISFWEGGEIVSLEKNEYGDYCTVKRD